MNGGYEILTLSQNNPIKGDEKTRDELKQRDTTTSTISSQYEYWIYCDEMSPTVSTVSKSLPNSNDKLSIIFRTFKLLIKYG